jgi:serine/threonine protein kinase/DNA-binding SARP family transcriptional activator/WD40 repeat protein
MTDMAGRGKARSGSFEAPGSEAGVEVALLGPTTVTRRGVRVELTGPKRRALLVLLALDIGVPISRDKIIEALWPVERTGREESTLRVHVSHLRDVLEPERGDSPEVLTTVEAGYKLSAEHVDLDIVRFDRLRLEARAILADDPAQALDLLNQALGLWSGRALQDVEYDEFAQEEIRRLELARVEAVEDRAEALVLVGEEALAIEDLEAQVRSDPSRERPVRLLMRALYRSGRQTEALAVARRHRRNLGEHGLEPSPLVVELEDRILSHDPTLYPDGAVAPADIKPGRALRGYELRDVAGRGAIGVVYRAFQPSVGREVAIKVIDRDLAQEPAFIRRFSEEAVLVASLEHPHIVPLYDFWRGPLGAFLVMRWMDGGTLADRLNRPWSVTEVGRVFGHLAEALDHAHSAGVVHRDVKPANVLFDSVGNAYLCDFGVAVTAADQADGRVLRTLLPPYAAPEALRGEISTVSADVYALGAMLGEVAALLVDADSRSIRSIDEIVAVATAPDPTDRFPDVNAFHAAIAEAVGTEAAPAPRRVRRNPFKGLAPFEEADHADFYGRDDLTETLVDHVGRYGLVAVVGASGSGKSSLVRAGLVPELRRGVLPGSDEWAIITMKPGLDPFEEFLIALRPVGVGEVGVTSGGSGNELRRAIEMALGGPKARCLLVVDQFEEMFSSAIDESVRERFIDALAGLASDPAGRSRVVVTIRADFADRPLGHPRLGDQLARGSLLVAPMPPDQIEDVIRRPAARVGVHVEPGLIAEIVRDVSSAPASLPLLQYVLTELFERRTEDRLTVQAYRQLGGVRAVLERQAERTYTALSPDTQQAARQLFLRMVQLGDRGEETRRRLPLDELDGLGRPGAVEEALGAFTDVRLLAYDRDPVSRTPTVEVAHEAVITQWTRYRVWIDEARSDLAVHRRVSTAAEAWAAADEDPGFLLSGGPLAAALDVISAGRVHFNEFESRFVEESAEEEESGRKADENRRRHEESLERTAKRRLRIGIAAAAALFVVAVLAGVAAVERQRADDLAAQRAGESRARSLAAASLNSLAGSDPDLSLLLAIASAEEALSASGEILAESVDALYRAVINPRPAVEVSGLGTSTGGQVVDYAPDGSLVVALAARGRGAVVIDPATGSEVGQIPEVPGWAATGVLFHPDLVHVLTIHGDAVRAWQWATGSLVRTFTVDGTIATAALSPAGDLVAIGDEAGRIASIRFGSGVVTATWVAHSSTVTSLDFDSTGRRLLSTGAVSRSGVPAGWTVIVWDPRLGTERSRIRESRFVLPIFQAAWSPATWEVARDAIVVTTHASEAFVLDATTGDTLSVLGNANRFSRSVAFNADGTLALLASHDGSAYVYSTWVGGEVAFTLPAGGVPLRDAAFNPLKEEIATIAIDGTLRIWNELVRSELPARTTWLLGTSARSSAEGDRLVVGGYSPALGLPLDTHGPRVLILDSDLAVIRSADAAVGLDLLLSSVEMSRDGSMAAYLGPSREVDIMHVESGRTLTIPDSLNWTASLAFSPDNQLIAGGGVPSRGELSITVWDVETGNVRHRLEGHGPPVPTNDGSITATLGTMVAFNPISGEVVSGGFDGTVRKWDLETAQSTILHTFPFEVATVAVSNDGSLVAASDHTGEMVLLDAGTGEVLLRPERVSGRPFLTFSPDDSLLAGAGPDAVTNVWDVASGRIIRRLHGAIYPARSVAFLEGGSVLLVASGESVQRRYVLDPHRLLELAIAEVGRGMSEAECLRYLDRSCEE